MLRQPLMLSNSPGQEVWRERCFCPGESSAFGRARAKPSGHARWVPKDKTQQSSRNGIIAPILVRCNKVLVAGGFSQQSREPAEAREWPFDCPERSRNRLDRQTTKNTHNCLQVSESCALIKRCNFIICKQFACSLRIVCSCKKSCVSPVQAFFG
jgi:hypothetical protein